MQHCKATTAVYSYYNTAVLGYSCRYIPSILYGSSSLSTRYVQRAPISCALYCLVPSARSRQMSRHTTPTTTPSTTTALSRSIALQRKGSPSTSRAPLSSTRRSTDTAVSQEGGGGAALGGAFRSATKENRQRQELPVRPLEVYQHAIPRIVLPSLR